MRRTPPNTARPVILFDGACNLCEQSVVNIIARDPYGNFQFAPLQSVAAERLLRAAGVTPPAPGEPLSTIMVIDGTRVLTCSDALVRVAQGLRWPWSLLAIFRWVPRGLRDSLYRWVALNRFQWFGRKATCLVPTEDLLDRFVPGADQIRPAPRP